MPRKKTSPDLALKQVWSPKRGTYSLRVLTIDADRGSARVQKFSPSGIYEPPVTGPYEVTVSISTIYKGYVLKDQP